MYIVGIKATRKIVAECKTDKEAKKFMKDNHLEWIFKSMDDDGTNIYYECEEVN